MKLIDIVALIFENVGAKEDQDPGEATPEERPWWSIERAGTWQWKILRHHQMQRDGPRTVGRVVMHQPEETFTVELEQDVHYTLGYRAVDYTATWANVGPQEMLQVVLGFLQDVDKPAVYHHEEEPPERVVRNLARHMVEERTRTVPRDQWVKEINSILSLISGVHGPAEDWARTLARAVPLTDPEEILDDIHSRDRGVSFGTGLAEIIEDQWREDVVWGSTGEREDEPSGRPTVGELAS